MKKLKVLSMGLALTFVLVVLGNYGALAAPTKAAAPKKPAPKVTAPKVTVPKVITPKTIKIYQGLGQNSTFRVGPGVDANKVQIYTLTTVTANATFDKSGKIINVYFDSLEISTPNYPGESMPHFSGWPGTPGYNVAEHIEGGKVTGVSNNTNETIAAEVSGWKTKRERGNTYGMNPKNDWYKQADFYQNFFKGKTVHEIENWFYQNCSDLNGRPLKADSTKPEDIAKYAKLTAAEKAKLADVVTGATMSLKDAHGDFLAALEEAYEKRTEVTVTVQ